MKVLLLTQYLALGGLERMLVSLATSLPAKGITCSVLAYERDGLNPAFLQELDASGIPTTVLQKQNRFCIRTLFKIRKIIKSANINIIHSHDLGALIYAVCVKIICGSKIKIVHTQHSFVHFKKKKKRYVIYEKFFTRIADCVCTVSEPLSHTYRTLGVPAHKLMTLPNGIRFERHFVTKQSARAKILGQLTPDSRALQLSLRNKRWLLYVGRLVEGKGLERLLTLWSSLPAESRNDWVLCLIGPIDMNFLREKLYPLALSQHALGHSILFLGPTSHPGDWYFASDAFASLSEQEGMPLAVAEAIGAGLPCLLTDIPGHQMMTPFSTVLPQRDSKFDLSTMSVFLAEAKLSSQERLNQWIQREQFRRCFGLNTMVEKYKAIYSNLSLRSSLSFPFLLCIFLTIIFFAPGATVRAEQQLTSVAEKPEYLTKEDFLDEVFLTLAPGESRILTIKNQNYCGDLPKLSLSAQEKGLSLQWYVGRGLTTTKPSYEGAEVRNYVDALVPIQKNISCTQDQNSRYEWLFAELSVDKKSSPRMYVETLESRMQPRQETSHSTENSQSWKLNIEVIPIELPDEWTLPLSAEFTPYYASMAHYGTSDLREGEITRAYVRAMVAHRVLPLKAWIRHPFKNPTERLNDEFKLSQDPNPKMSYGTTVVSELPQWAAVDLPRIDTASEPERLDYWARWASFFESHSNDPSETALQKRMAQKPFVYLWDEPTQEEYSNLRDVAESLKQGAPNVAALVTIYPWPGLQDIINIFAPLLQILEREGPPQMQPGNQLWSYVSCMSHGCGSDRSSGEPDFVIERNAAYIRVWPWMAEHYNLQRILYYSVNNAWRKSPRVNPWDDLWDFSGNGDGTLFYPGRSGENNLTEHTPVASLRLKLWRQASFDAEYIALAKKLNADCFDQVKEQFKLVENAFTWSRQSRDYDLARQALIACISPEKNLFNSGPALP